MNGEVAPGGVVPVEAESPQQKYSRLYQQASRDMDEHYRRARAGSPCDCIDAGNAGQMCSAGQAIYATVVNPLLLDREARR